MIDDRYGSIIGNISDILKLMLKIYSDPTICLIPSQCILESSL